MKTSDFNYDLPEELIAQSPIEQRDHSRLMVLNRADDSILHEHFYDIVDFLTPNDVLVINVTKVMPARLFCKKENCSGNIEVLLLKRKDLTTFETLVRPGRRVQIGARLVFSDNLTAQVVDKTEDGGRIVKFEVGQGTFEEEIDKIGEMPLPPYITKKLQDKNRYQTVYAKDEKSAAAPTAGLHFTNELLDKIKAKGVQIEEVLLDVGLGTFRPVKTETIEQHHMHTEHCVVKPDVAKRLNDAKSNGKRIIAVGTTSVRTLETACKGNQLVAGEYDTSIFIYPGVKLNFVDAIITNFHLPESTLIMLVSAFYGREKTLRAYEIAVKERYRFFSFGDAMFIR